MNKKIKKNIVVSLLLPISVLILMVFAFNLALSLGINLIAHILNQVLNLVYYFPLHVVGWLGLIGANQEGIYDQWAGLTTLGTIGLQSLILFVVLEIIRRHNKDASGNPTPPDS